MRNGFILVILLVFCTGCQKNSEPEEIVRIVPGKSLMEQVAPTMNRQKQGNRKIYLVQDSFSTDQVEKHLNNKPNNNIRVGYQPLYISGNKAKAKKALKEQMSKKAEPK